MFTVDPDRVRDWAARLDALAGDAGQAAAYADRHIRCTGGTGAFLLAAAAMDEARVTLVDSATAMQRLLAGSSGELIRTADRYEDTDRTETARLDALYPGGTILPPPAAPPSGPASDGGTPASALGPPVVADPIPDVIEGLINLPDLVSPGFWLLEVFNLVFGVNPAQWLGEFAAGDWNQFALAADALHNLADFDTAMAASIERSAADVLGGTMPGWGGEAASAAGTYFGGLATAVEGQAAAVRALGAECRSLAFGMYQAAKGVEDVVKIAVDWAIVTAALFAAAAVTSETVVGGVAGSVAAVVAATIAYQYWLRAVDVVSGMLGAASIFVGAMAGYLGPLRDVAAHPLPAGAYDHAQV